MTRIFVSRELDGETVGFPFVAQAARVRRERVGQAPETVELITSRLMAALPPDPWLICNINHWGIETGLHARLDASRHDDRCRLIHFPYHLNDRATGHEFHELPDDVFSVLDRFLGDR